jgi:hypothetical protein
MTAKSFRPNVAAVIMHPTNKKVLKNQKNLPTANRQFLLLHYLKVLMMKNMNLKKKDYKETIVRKTMSSLEMAALIKNP